MIWKSCEIHTRNSTRLKASVTASKLSIRLLAKNALSVFVQEGLSEPQSHEIASGNHISYDEGSRVKISHHDWEIDISSGESNFDALVQEFEETNQHLIALLEQHGVENLNEAIDVNKDYTDVSSKRQFSKEQSGSGVGWGDL